MPAVPPRRRVLAVDDTPAILELYVDLLTQVGYRVTAGHLPGLDVARVGDLTPDLVVLDLPVGPQDPGMAFLADLKADPATGRVPVLVCTAVAHRFSPFGDRLPAWGCTVVTKPFDVGDFLAAAAGCTGKACDPCRAGESPWDTTPDPAGWPRA